MQYFHVTDRAVLMGHRRFVCTDNITDDQILEDINVALNLPEAISSNEYEAHIIEENAKKGEPITELRFDGYKKNNYLKDDIFPFYAFYGCSMNFPKKVIEDVGGFDEEFQAWGAEDNEMGYRIYNAGYYFIPVLKAIALHQEPPKSKISRLKGQEITKGLIEQRCPVPQFRNYQANIVYQVPKVSIYMAAYNAEKYIKTAVDSALAQTYTDLEVCIVNDGSTDNTLKVLENNYRNNSRVRWITQKNSGVANTFTVAVNMCRGLYCGHLDADDVLLRKDAVEIMVKYLDTHNVGCIYSSLQIIDENGASFQGGWEWPKFSREKLMTSMIVHHFRLFRKRDWARLGKGFDETVENAEDYDLFLRLSEICSFYHINEIFYGYRWHGKNVSVVHSDRQERNHVLSIERALKRLKLDEIWKIKLPDPIRRPRYVVFEKVKKAEEDFFSNDQSILENLKQKRRQLVDLLENYKLLSNSDLKKQPLTLDEQNFLKNIFDRKNYDILQRILIAALYYFPDQLPSQIRNLVVPEWMSHYIDVSSRKIQNIKKANDTIADVTIVIKTFLRPRALDRLLHDIKRYYPAVKVYVADDSDKPQIRKDVDEYFVLPFESGASYGRNYMIDRVKTKYIMLLDDDTIFTENTKIEWALEVFNASKRIDLVAGRCIPDDVFYGSLLIENNNLIRDMKLAKTVVDGFPQFDFYPNFFVAKTGENRKNKRNKVE